MRSTSCSGAIPPHFQIASTERLRIWRRAHADQFRTIGYMQHLGLRGVRRGIRWHDFTVVSFEGNGGAPKSLRATHMTQCLEGWRQEWCNRSCWRRRDFSVSSNIECIRKLEHRGREFVYFGYCGNTWKYTTCWRHARCLCYLDSTRLAIYNSLCRIINHRSRFINK